MGIVNAVPHEKHNHNNENLTRQSGEEIKRQKKRSNNRNYRVKRRSANPFIVFYLRMRDKRPREPVTVIARAAGRLWAQMDLYQKQKYIDIANAEKKRRVGARKRFYNF